MRQPLTWPDNWRTSSLRDDPPGPLERWAAVRKGFYKRRRASNACRSSQTVRCLNQSGHRLASEKGASFASE